MLTGLAPVATLDLANLTSHVWETNCCLWWAEKNIWPFRFLRYNASINYIHENI